MELISKIKGTWKICIIGSLLCFFLFVLYLNQIGKNTSLLNARNTVQQLPSYDESKAPSSALSIPPTQNFTPTSTTFSNPPSQKFSSNQVEVPMSNTMAKSPAQSQAPMSNTMAKPPVQESPPHDELGASIKSSSFSQASISSNINETAIPNLINQTHMNEFKKYSNKTEEMQCNMFEGRWVYKPEASPSYDSIKCPFIEEKFSCQKNGRPDNDYEKWRWEANDCDIPLFNGRDMLERLRNKRVIIVGDSLNRNMWESLACLLYTSIPSSRAEVQAKQSEYKVLKAKDYNAVIEFHWSPFLVEYDLMHKSGNKVLVLDKLSRNSKLWRGADIMVFNSAYWWAHSGKFQKWDVFQYKGQLVQEGIPLDRAYEIGLKTWAKWIENNVDSKKTIVFFRSVSAQHNGNPHCHDVIQPINDDSSYQNYFPKSLINIMEIIIKGIDKPKVINLDVTKLSEYRIDAHPSVFKSWHGKIYATKYKSLTKKNADCSHWCLPGLPDTWNHLLYSILIFNSTRIMSSS